jgi:hypothetical protein
VELREKDGASTIAAALPGARETNRRITMRSSLTRIVALAVATSFAMFCSGRVAFGQSLPTYGLPTSPLLQGYEAHAFRTFQLNVPVFVPLAELQNILPAGFTAIASPSGSSTAQVTLGLIYHQRTERVGSVDGPASSLAVTATVRNVSLGRNETVLLANEQSNAASVANANAIFGEGTTRLAEVESEIEEESGLLQLNFDVTDEDIGLKLKVRARVSALNMTRVALDPNSTPFRALNGTVAANSFFQTMRYDNVSLSTAAGNPRVDVPGSGDVLRLPGGNLSILNVGAAMTFQRWRENYTKLEGQ